MSSFSLFCLCASFLLVLSAACGESGAEDIPPRYSGPIDTAKPVNSAGPQSLAVAEWVFPVREANGLKMRNSFEFSSRSISLTVSCSDGTSVGVGSMVNYTYQVEIAGPLKKRTGNDDTYCEVSLSPFGTHLTIDQEKLVISDGQQTLSLDAAGNNVGIYGLWSTRLKDRVVNVTFGDEQVSVEAVCDNGLQAEVVAPAAFTNYLELTQSITSNENNPCVASLNASTMSYKILKDGRLEVQNEEGTFVARPKKYRNYF